LVSHNNLSTFVNIFATTICFYTSGVIDSSKASSYIYLVLIFAVILGIIFLGESIEFNSILAGITTVFALYLINKKV